MTNKTRRLTESAMLLAIAVVLELISKTFIPELHFGGQITLVSMLPVVLISYRHGVKWGFVSAFAYALLEMAIGTKTVMAAFQDPEFFSGGVQVVNAIVMCVLDYVVAFTVLGLGGIFRKSIKNPGLSLMTGSLVALGARYLTHIVSGWILFSGFANYFFTQEGFPAWGTTLTESLSPSVLGFVYSVVYNGMYMLPEILITAVVAVILARIPKIVTKVS